MDTQYYVFFKYNDLKSKTVLVVKMNRGYCERVNEQVIDGDSLEMGRIGVPFVGYRGVVTCTFCG
jgi:hypothetical protein